MKKANVSIRRWTGGTCPVCHGLREAESARPPEQGRAGVQDRQVHRRPWSTSKKRSNSIPTFPTARLYLATAYMSQYIPGAESPENQQNAKLPSRNS